VLLDGLDPIVIDQFVIQVAKMGDNALPQIPANVVESLLVLPVNPVLLDGVEVSAM